MDKDADMTPEELHALAEEAVPPLIHVKLVDGAEPRSEVVAWVERALAKQQEAHEAELYDLFERRTKDINAAVAETLERAARIADAYNYAAGDSIRSLKPSSDMVCVPRDLTMSMANVLFAGIQYGAVSYTDAQNRWEQVLLAAAGGKP